MRLYAWQMRQDRKQTRQKSVYNPLCYLFVDDENIINDKKSHEIMEVLMGMSNRKPTGMCKEKMTIFTSRQLEIRDNFLDQDN